MFPPPRDFYECSSRIHIICAVAWTWAAYCSLYYVSGFIGGLRVLVCTAASNRHWAAASGIVTLSYDFSVADAREWYAWWVFWAQLFDLVFMMGFVPLASDSLLLDIGLKRPSSAHILKMWLLIIVNIRGDDARDLVWANLVAFPLHIWWRLHIGAAFGFVDEIVHFGIYGCVCPLIARVFYRMFLAQRFGI
ncbi:hypothetical protein WJX73_010545 [Symbiochloris irregularis]|uniref:Uncharacterized protein n=1 Tax=Symbiochloris irregularis TaxID=706552 RepID=A0AAW1NXI4_9CHLO